MHSNSLLAYAESQTHLSAREQMIVARMQQDVFGEWTDRQMMNALGFTDMNAVRPRITSLVQKGILKEVGSVRDMVTGKTVRTVSLVEAR